MKCHENRIPFQPPIEPYLLRLEMVVIERLLIVLCHLDKRFVAHGTIFAKRAFRADLVEFGARWLRVGLPTYELFLCQELSPDA